MQTISLRGTVSDDGMLRLEVPIGTRGEEIEVVVVMQPRSTPAYFSLKDLAGTIDDETLVAPEELPFEAREELL